MKKFRIDRIVACGALTASLLLSLTAYAEGMAVRYSYSKTEFDGQPTYALVPNVDPRFDSRTNKLNVKKAFDALKADKSNTYLNSTATISGTDRAPKVSVKIDPAAAAKGYGLIIMAETVYTLGELGVPEVSFPGLASRPMRRGDIPFASFSVNIPLWKALSPSSKREAIDSPNISVLMPDGSLVPSSEIANKWKKKDKDLDNTLFTYLEAPDTYTVKEVAKLMKTWKLPYGGKGVALLNNPSTSVQNAGLELLADERDDEKVLASVKSYLDRQRKKDKLQAAAAALWLGESKNKSYSIEKPLFFIDNGNTTQAVQSALDLANYSDKSALTKLEENLTNKDEPVAIAAAEALGKSNQNAIERKALDDKKVSSGVKLVLSKNLVKSKEESDQLAGLKYLVEHGSVKERTEAVAQIGEIPSSAARSLLDGYLTSSDEFVAQAAAAQLLRRAEAGSLDAIAKAIKSGEHTDEALKIGDAIMAKLDFKEIEKKTRDRNNEIQRLAYRALGNKAKIRSVLELLENALDNKDATIRGAAVISILAFQPKYSDRVEAAIKKAAADKDPNVRRNAAIAIAQLPDGKLGDVLMTLINDTDPLVKAATIDAMALRKEAASWDQIKNETKSTNDVLRAAAYRALAELVSPDDKKGVREVISLLSGAVNDKSKLVKLAAIQGLGHFRDDRAVASIAVNASSDDIAIRIAILDAVAASGHPSAKAILVAGLDDPDAAVRSAAIKGLGLLKDKSAKGDLEKHLQTEKDPDLQKLIQKTAKSL